MRRGLIVCLLFLLCLTACQGSKDIKIKEISEDELVETSPVSGGTLELPLTHMDTVNPLLTKNTDYFYFSKLIFESLYISDALGNFKNNLAEHYEFSEDGLTLSVTLKKDLRWHDGQPLTAQDVADTFNAILDLPADNPYLGLIRHSMGSCNSFSGSGSCRAVAFDERNVDFQFDRPYRNVLQMLTFPVLPSHLLSQEDRLKEEGFPMVGSGPFRYMSGDTLKPWTLEKNPNYWGQPPYIDKVQGKILENKGQGTNALETGQVDLSMNDGYDWDRERNSSRIQVEEFPTNELEFLAINMKQEKFQGSQGQALRQAMARGINKARIIDSLCLGKAIQTSSLIHPKSKYADYISQSIYYNVDTGRNILKKAGFKENERGFFTFPDGRELRIAITTNSFNYNRKATVDLIIDDLRRMGLEAYGNYLPVDNRKEKDPAKQKEEWDNFQKQIKDGNFDLALVGMQMTPLPDLSSLLYSGMVGQSNLSSYSSQEMDQYLKKLSLRSVDEDEKTLYNKITELFYRDCPYIPLYFKQGAILKDKRIRRSLEPSVYDLYHRLSKTYIPKEYQD